MVRGVSQHGVSDAVTANFEYHAEIVAATGIGGAVKEAIRSFEEL